MALNRMMHPRNRYKDAKPDFKKLAEKYDKLRQFADNTGRVHLDFKNAECLRALTWCLLKEDFDLDVLLPPDRLIPTIPLRLNYILWLEDLLGTTVAATPVCGIDIGTGASCVYALLGSRKNNWRFLATEADAVNCEVATKNVERNDLQSSIEVRRVVETAILSEVITESEGRFDFCMCNPPFFGSNMEAWGMTNSRTDSRPEHRSASTASPQESVFPGGEVQFVKRMIEESLELRDRIRIYTSMLGKKSSLLILKAELRNNGITNFGTTEFCQGRTMRWGIGWSYDPTVVFPVSLRKQMVDKSIPALTHIVPRDVQCTSYVLNDVKKFVLDCLHGLQMPMEVLKDESDGLECLIMPVENTWSHQRRKRREMKKQGQPQAAPSTTDLSLEPPTKRITPERTADVNTQDIEHTGEYVSELSAIDAAAKSSEGLPSTSSHDIGNVSADERDCLFTSCVNVKCKDTNIVVEMRWVDGQNRELMHQVMQYVKNRLK